MLTTRDNAEDRSVHRFDRLFGIQWPYGNEHWLVTIPYLLPTNSVESNRETHE